MGLLSSRLGSLITSIDPPRRRYRSANSSVFSAGGTTVSFIEMTCISGILALAIGARVSMGLPEVVCCFFGQSVFVQTSFHVTGIAAAYSFSSRPTADVADRRIAINTGDAIGPTGCETVDEQSAATDTFQCRSLGQPAFGYEPDRTHPNVSSHADCPAFHRYRFAQCESRLDQNLIDLVVVAGKSGPPNPGIPLGRLLRDDDVGRSAVNVKIVSIESVPGRFLAGPRPWPTVGS